MSTKDEIISKTYYDFGGYGSIARTLKEAKEIDPSIKAADIQSWKERNLQRKTNLRGHNSFVASESKQEYQIDLFEMPVSRVADKRFTPTKPKNNRRAGEGVISNRKGVVGKTEKTEKIYRYGLLLVDIFSKFCKVVPIETKTIPEFIESLKTGINDMGGKPETIYCDGEGAIGSNEMKAFLADENIRLIQTRRHAAVAERHIRTIKDALFKRMEHLKTDIDDWHTILPPVLLQYNTRMIHSSMEMTPADAKLPRNESLVKARLEIKRISKRKYPEVKEGDSVKVYQKKDKLDKERVSTWSTQLYKIDTIIESHGQTLYTVTPKIPNWNKDLVRSEILLI